MSETKYYLSMAEVAEIVGVTPGTVRSLNSKGYMPPPDVIVGKSRASSAPGWLPETIEVWKANRPGRTGRPKKTV
jgi:predicted DNA-binding transcriptional regulator AlpA